MPLVTVQVMDINMVISMDISMDISMAIIMVMAMGIQKHVNNILTKMNVFSIAVLNSLILPIFTLFLKAAM